MSHKAQYIDLGLIDYKQAWDYQQKKADELINADEKTNYLIFCEHPHVYTLGKSGKPNNLLINDEFLKKIKASFFKTNRGGDITYHGPGQIVAYPIFDLNYLKIGVKNHVHKIEEAVIKTLAEYNIKSERLEGATGVWIDTNKPDKTRKICAIGVRVTKFVTMHGLALNVNTDLNYFKHINPCGYIDKSITSLGAELNVNVDTKHTKKILLKYFTEIFELKIHNSLET